MAAVLKKKVDGFACWFFRLNRIELGNQRRHRQRGRGRRGDDEWGAAQFWGKGRGRIDRGRGRCGGGRRRRGGDEWGAARFWGKGRGGGSEGRLGIFFRKISGRVSRGGKSVSSFIWTWEVVG